MFNVAVIRLKDLVRFLLLGIIIVVLIVFCKKLFKKIRFEKINIGKNIATNLEEYIKKSINMELPNIDKNRSKRWYIKELSNIEKHIGGRIDFIDFYAHTKEEIEERLMNVDLIYIVGGKQHIYSKIFNETDTVDLIKKIAERKVLMGTSKSF